MECRRRGVPLGTPGQALSDRSRDGVSGTLVEGASEEQVVELTVVPAEAVADELDHLLDLLAPARTGLGVGTGAGSSCTR